MLTSKFTFSFLLLSKKDSSFLLGVVGVLIIFSLAFLFKILLIKFKEVSFLSCLIPVILVAAICLHIKILFCECLELKSSQVQLQPSIFKFIVS